MILFFLLDLYRCNKYILFQFISMIHNIKRDYIIKKHRIFQNQYREVVSFPYILIPLQIIKFTV